MEIVATLLHLPNYLITTITPTLIQLIIASLLSSKNPKIFPFFELISKIKMLLV